MTLTSANEGAQYLSACAGGLVEEGLFMPWAERAVHLERWLADIDVKLILADTATWGLSREEYGADMWAEHPNLPGSKAVRVWRTATNLLPRLPAHGGMTGDTGLVQGGEAIYRGLMKAVEDNGIEVHWNSRAKSLIVDHSQGRAHVRGVRVAVDGSDESEEIIARAVVIATGGFGGNPEYVRQFLPVPNTRFYGNPDNDGDGLRMAMSVGADLVRMTRMVGRGILSFPVDGRDIGFLFVMSGGGYVICDQDGSRFADEYEQAQQQHTFYYKLMEFDTHRVKYPRSPSYWIFDERRRKAGPLPFTDRSSVAGGLYDWSQDNQRELEAGWIAQGDTPGAAAAGAGATDPARFDAEVAAYNEGCRQGKDVFGRPKSTLIPLDSPPYYCVPLYIGGPYTHGGPRRDLQGRVISTDGEAIPGLFSTGEMGQAVGLMYPASGASIAEALCLGELAGESTMQEISRRTSI